MPTRLMVVALTLVSVFCSVVYSAQQNKKKVPQWSFKFEDYAAATDFKGRPAAPILTTKSARMYRTQIRLAAREGPNFAGHYTIAEWGCGSGCVSIAVIDAVSGKVFDAPFNYIAFPLRDSPNGREFQGLVYKVSSRLFIADGCPNDVKCGTYYYEWIASQFKLLRYNAQAAPAK